MGSAALLSVVMTKSSSGPSVVRNSGFKLKAIRAIRALNKGRFFNFLTSLCVPLTLCYGYFKQRLNEKTLLSTHIIGFV